MRRPLREGTSTLVLVVVTGAVLLAVGVANAMTVAAEDL
jgi:fructose-specific phosphotransferase system IIC component